MEKKYAAVVSSLDLKSLAVNFLAMFDCCVQIHYTVVSVTCNYSGAVNDNIMWNAFI